MKTIKRKVTIERLKDMWFVRYADRTKGSRHSPAQFYAPDNSLESVKAWIANNPKLELQS